MWGLEKDGVVEPVSIAFVTSFWYTSSWYTPWLVNCDSILQHLCPTFDFACTESNEPVHLYSMTVKPSYTAPFEIVTLDISLTQEMVFQKLDEKRVDWGKCTCIWKDVYRLYPSLFLQFLTHSLFHCSLVFFTHLHWPRAWHRLHNIVQCKS